MRRDGTGVSGASRAAWSVTHGLRIGRTPWPTRLGSASGILLHRRAVSKRAGGSIQLRPRLGIAARAAESRAAQRRSGDDCLVEHALDVGEPHAASRATAGQALMVEAEQVEGPAMRSLARVEPQGVVR